MVLTLCLKNRDPLFFQFGSSTKSNRRVANGSRKRRHCALVKFGVCLFVIVIVIFRRRFCSAPRSDPNLKMLLLKNSFRYTCITSFEKFSWISIPGMCMSVFSNSSSDGCLNLQVAPELAHPSPSRKSAHGIHLLLKYIPCVLGLSCPSPAITSGVLGA